MPAEKPPRWLGRGIPPSQPAPSYLRAPLDAVAAPSPPHRIILAVLGGLTALVLIAGALFAWRRHDVKVAAPQPVMSGVVRGAASMDPLALVLAGSGDMKVTTELLAVDKVWIDACQRPGPGRTPPDQCDRQPFFERALVRAVVRGADCVPEQPRDESISFALEVDHKRRTTRLFAGRSGTLSKAQAKPVIACVQRSLEAPDWESIPHDHTRYVIGVLARYPAQKRK